MNYEKIKSRYDFMTMIIFWITLIALIGSLMTTGVSVFTIKMYLVFVGEIVMFLVMDLFLM